MRSHDNELDHTTELRPAPSRLESEQDGYAAQAAADGRLDAIDLAGITALQRTAGNAAVSRLVGDEEESPVHDVLRSGGGSALPDNVRADMEGRLGEDFSDVRVHTDSKAHDSAVSVNAQAYTVGSDVVFQEGKYDTSSTEGQTMLAHELTHVVQQRSGPVDGSPAAGGINISHPNDPFEREASANAERVMAGSTAAISQAPGSIQRDEDLPEQEEPDVQGSFLQREDELDEEPEE